VARLAPAGRQGGGFGWYTLVQGLMALPAGLLAGWHWQQGPAGPAKAIAATAVLATAACGLLLVSVRESEPLSQRIERRAARRPPTTGRPD